ncbi:MAG: hypothetical protein AB1805_12700 [Nitrospirota bacterium]
MFREFKKHFSMVIHGKSGERFITYYRHRREERQCHPVRRALLITLGIALVLAGAALGFVPGLPGIVLGIPGLAIIAGQFRIVAAFFDRAELFLVRFLVRVRAFLGFGAPR